MRRYFVYRKCLDLQIKEIKFMKLYLFETNCTWDSIYVNP